MELKLNRYIGHLNWMIFIIGTFMLIIGNYTWLIAILLSGSIIAVQLLQNNKIPEIQITRLHPGKHFKERDHIRIKIRIHNTSANQFRGELYDKLPAGTQVVEGTNVFLFSVAPNETVNLNYKISFKRRGTYKIGPIKVRYLSLGGLHEARWEVDIRNELVIVPVPDPVSTFPLRPKILRSMGGLFKSKLLGEGFDFAGVREYRRGDPLNRINWKQTAKHGELHANEYQLNRSSKFIIVLDLTEESKDIADASVRSTLGLANFLSTSRSKVGVMTMGEYIHYIPPKTGKRHLLEISQHLTNADSVGKMSNLELFKQRLSATIDRIKGSDFEILLFSSLSRPEITKLQTDLLQELGKISIFAPSALSKRDDSTPEFDLAISIINLRKQTIKQNLQLKGINVYEWNPQKPFEGSLRSWREN